MCAGPTERIRNQPSSREFFLIVRFALLKAQQQNAPSKRFDIFVPEKAADSGPPIRFQDPAKGRSNRVLNMTERLWKSTEVYVPTNVSIPEAASPGFHRLMLHLYSNIEKRGKSRKLLI